jgi:hypothetical protein
MRFGKDSIIYLITCILSTTSLAACTNSLVQRNHNIGEQSRAAAARGSESYCLPLINLCLVLMVYRSSLDYRDEQLVGRWVCALSWSWGDRGESGESN